MLLWLHLNYDSMPLTVCLTHLHFLFMDIKTLDWNLPLQSWFVSDEVTVEAHGVISGERKAFRRELLKISFHLTVPTDVFQAFRLYILGHIR